ncbi:MAG: lysophospholipid acyltransferase family protein [Methylococcales bacterium]|nr:lysophospholipid acyltransferase family protein [Methylococcales bacterium]
MTQHNTLSPDPRPKNYLGSTLLFIGIFSTASIAGILILLTTPLPFNVRYQISRAWCGLVLWMGKIFCGVRYEVEGLEHLNTGQASIVLSNHQSAWETLALRFILTPTQAPLLKRSLTWFPVWGWALSTLKPIPIDRKNQREALRTLLEKGKLFLNQGLWVIVFPEGTRTAAGEVKKFSAGGAILAQQSGCPVIPVAHNAGNFWPRYSFLKYPGTIKVKIGPVIESRGRKAADINADAESWIAQTINEL